MGKSHEINSLAASIGLVAAHKIILKKTAKPESSRHLSDEIRDYSFDAFEKAQAHSWNRDEKEQIREKSEKRARQIMERYPDIELSDGEIPIEVKDTMQELMML